MTIAQLRNEQLEMIELRMSNIDKFVGNVAAELDIIINELDDICGDDIGYYLDPTLGELNVTFHGDSELYAKVYQVLRQSNYMPEKRISKEEKSYFSTWYRDEQDNLPALYVVFSSTVCRRVKVGTKMEEVPVYETVCD